MQDLSLTSPLWAKPKFVALIILVYLAVHFALRMAMWPTLGVDDAEQALFAQNFAWSYRYRNPPLFTWLLFGLGRIVGIDILSISLLRYALLGLTFAFAYLTARRLIADPRLSALSVYSFAAIYVFAYYSHHDLTHTTALAAMLAVAWYVFVRIVDAPKLGWYLALGAITGLGLLAKWNFVMFAAALLLACLLRPAYRHLVLTWKIVPAILVAALIALPTVIAVLTTGPMDGEDIHSVLEREPGSFFARLVKGTGRLFGAVIVYPEPLLPLLLVTLGVALWRGLRVRSPELQTDLRRPDAAIIGWTMAISIALHWAMVLTWGASKFSERLMQPPLFILPIWLFMLIERGRPSERALNVFARVLVVLALATLAARAGIYFLRSSDHCDACRAKIPFRQLAAELGAAGFSGRGTILADGFHIGGNMRALFPQVRIIDPTYPPAIWPSPSGEAQCLLLWQERDDPALTASAAKKLQAYLAGELGGDPDAPHRDGFAKGLLFGSKTREYRLNYRLYEGPVGDCR